MELKKQERKDVPLKDIKLAEYNPRLISPDKMEQLKKSITTNGLVDPVIVNSNNMVVVGGNQRIQAMRELGVKIVPDVVMLELTDEEEKALNLALNALTGEWDYIKLESLLKELYDAEFDMDLTGFDSAEIDAMIDTDVNFSFETADIVSDEERELPPDAVVDIEGEKGHSYVAEVYFANKENAEELLARCGLESPAFRGHTKLVNGDELLGVMKDGGVLHPNYCTTSR